GRIEAILDWATARGDRPDSFANPASRHGPLLKGLPKQSRAVTHHAAMPYADVPRLMAELRQQTASVAAPALEFAILTTSRTNEVLGACWEEVDLAAAIWTIPPARMKARREHRVPLSDPALAVIERMAKLRCNTFVFPGMRSDGPLSNMALLNLLHRMGQRVTAHGFRSSFRDWAAETTDFPSEVVEMALAHAVANKVEAAYRRGDLFAKRRMLMNEWAQFCGKPPGEVVTLRARS